MAVDHATLDIESISYAGYIWNEQTQSWDGPPGAPKGKNNKGLGAVGAFVYWEHPTADVLCLSFTLPGDPTVYRWRPGWPNPQNLFGYLARGGLIECHNVMFEKLGWWHVLQRKYGWPPLDHTRVSCSMATAHVNGYPGGLGDLGESLDTNFRKDPEGSALMDVFSKPRKPTEGDQRRVILPTDSQPVTFRRVKRDPHELFERYHDYCDTDVLTEADASSRMEPMTPAEREAWLSDQTMNWRGIAIDRAAVRDCIAVLGQALEQYGKECERLTGGLGPSQVQALVGWIHGRGVRGIDSFDSKKSPVEEHLKRTDLPDDVRRVLEIRTLVGSAGVKKLYAMENRTSCDDRLRGLFVHHGTRTGRPTGEGVQTTNLVKVGPKLVWSACCERPVLPTAQACPWCGSILGPPGKPKWTIGMVAYVKEIMSFRSLPMVEQFFGDAVLCIQGCIRSMLVAASGHELIAADYSAIEAVVAACISGEQWRIDTFKRREDIYLRSISTVTSIPYAEYLAYNEEHGQHHPDRANGKILELAAGFGGWIGSWRAFDPDEASKSDEHIAGLLDTWRKASPNIVAMWGGQRRKVDGYWRDELFGIEGAFIRAVQNPGQEYAVGPLSFRMTAPFGTYDRLKMRLPSGRELTYHQPILTPSSRRPGTLSISYMTDNSNPKYGALGWVRMETWGSRVFENCLAEGTEVLTERGWVKIENILITDRIHDGVELVNHRGSVYKSVQACMEIDGVWMTPDHEVLDDAENWRPASSVQELFRPKVRDVTGASVCAEKRETTPYSVGMAMRLRARMRKIRAGRVTLRTVGTDTKLRVFGRKIHWRKEYQARHEPSSRIRGLSVDAGSLSVALPPSLAQLRRPGNLSLRIMAGIFRKLLGGYGADVCSGTGDRPRGQRRQLHSAQCPLGQSTGQFEQPQRQRLAGYSLGTTNRLTSGAGSRDRQGATTLEVTAGLAGRSTFSSRRVYDILNCGPRQRFVVRGENGPFITHNCVQAIAHCIMRHARHALEAAGYPIVQEVYDEAVAEVPVGFGSFEEFVRIMGTLPEWAVLVNGEPWPIRAADPWRGREYRKA